MKKILILGSTGSIGRQTLQIIDRHKDRFEVVGLCCKSSYNELNAQIKIYNPAYAAIERSDLKDKVLNIKNLYTGVEGIISMCRDCGADIVVAAMVGLAGLDAVLACIDAGMRIALANKETLVGGGRLVMKKAEESECEVIPIDSEHSAIFQCLQNRENEKSIKNLILTASGGPFVDFPADKMDRITPEMALNHPNWKMGRKVTIDSATMMNKGLEVIEAHWLFNISVSRIKVAIQRQSIVHSMVEFKDNSIIAQMGLPDMRIPIQYALTYPERLECPATETDIFSIPPIDFIKPDMVKFPCLNIAYEAIKHGKGKTVVVNAANEIAVNSF